MYNHSRTLLASIISTAVGVGLVGIAPVALSQGSQLSLEEVIVTAQRREQRLQDVPLSVQSLSGDFLEKSGVSDMRDLTMAVPGMTFVSQGPFAQPAIRGVTTGLTQAGSDSPIAIYMDGFYQPSQIGNLFELPDVQRIEVLKGPQGTLFGRNATGGAISVHTLSPEYETTGNVSLSAGVYNGGSAKSSNEMVAKAYVTGGLIDDVLAGSISAFYKDNQGYLTNIVDNSRSGGSESYLVRGKLLFEPSEGMSFTLGAYHGESRDYAGNAITAIDGMTVAGQYPDAIIPSRPWQVASELKNGVTYIETEYTGINLKSVFDFSAGTLTSLTGYTEVDGLIVQDVDGAYSPACQAVVACITPYWVDYGPAKTFQQEFSFSSEISGDLSYVAGAFFYWDDHNIESRINPSLAANGKVSGEDKGVFYTKAKVETTAYAAFGELSWDITDRLTLIGGLRYSWEEKVGKGTIMDGPKFDFSGSPDWDSWTPRLSLLYTVNDQLNVYATYSEGFKSGVVESVGLSTDVADPEEIKSYEVGMKYDAGRYQINVAAYYYDYTDVQVQFFDGLRNIMGNAADAEIYGLDVDAMVLLTSSLELRASFSWLPTAEYKTFENALAFAPPFGPYGMQELILDVSGDRMLKSPKFTGNITLNYSKDVEWGNVDANLVMYYSDSYKWELSNRFKNDSHTTLSARVSLQPRDSNFVYSLWGKNLTNEEYLLGATPSGQSDSGIWASPRQLGATVEYRF